MAAKLTAKQYEKLLGEYRAAQGQGFSNDQVLSLIEFEDENPDNELVIKSRIERRNITTFMIASRNPDK